MKLTKRLLMSVVALGIAGAMSGVALAADTIAIITPSHDNPFSRLKRMALR